MPEERALIVQIARLAEKLPTGIIDPDAMMKLRREQDELTAARASGDALGALLEAGDVAYYAIKAWRNDMLTFGAAYNYIHRAARLVGRSKVAVLVACRAKMTCRAQPGNPKDDSAERAAVERALEECHA